MPPRTLQLLALLALVGVRCSCCLPTAEFQAALDLHNSLRQLHGCGPLSWDDGVAASTQEWADRGKYEHGSDGRFGECIAMGQGSASTATQDFYNEEKSYDFSRPGFSGATGHFSQVVWCGSQRLGIGKGCAEGRTFYVFRYDPPGNVAGQFEANVLPAGASSSQPSASASASASTSASASSSATASATAEAAAGATASASASADLASAASTSASAQASASASASTGTDSNALADAFAAAFASADSQPSGDSQQQQQQQAAQLDDVPAQSGRRLARRLAQ